MLFILWALLSVFIVFCLDLFSFTASRTGWRRFVGTFVLFYAQVIFSEFAVGLLGQLTGLNLVVVNLLISGALLLYLHHRHGPPIYRQYLASIRRFINSWVQSIRGDHLFIALLALAVAISGWVLLLGILLPVTDFDGNSYHMTFIAQ